MITRNYRSETAARSDTVAAGIGIMKSIMGVCGRWLTRRQAIRQLYRPDRPVRRDLAVDQSEFNSIIFGDVADRRRPVTKH